MTAIRFSLFTICFCLLAVLSLTEFASSTAAQDASSSALGRGYRTGYTDGYDNGFADVANRAQRDFSNKTFYRSADRAYTDSYGPIDDYKDGYRQGFEAGYNAGFDHQQFNSTIPDGLQRRNPGQVSAPRGNSADPPKVIDSSSSGNRQNQPVNNGSSTGVSNLPTNASLRIELLNDISTDVSQRGDPFQARVLEPANLAGAIIQGHVSLVKRPGKLKGSGELQLAFDRITPDGGVPAPFDAQVVEVLTTAKDHPVGTVDKEGGVKGQDSTKDDVTKIGAGTGVGAAIGAIAGGGKGALIGAVIGGGASTGGVMMTRGKDLRLPAGQQLRIQTSREIRF